LWRELTFRTDSTWTRTKGSFEKKLARAAAYDPRRPAVDILSLAEAKQCGRWPRALASQRKDRRFYEILDGTIRQDLEYRFFAIRDGAGEIRAIVPFFLTDLDLLAGLPGAQRFARLARRFWPRFMRVPTLMVGCAAGEGHLDDGDELSPAEQAQSLSRTIVAHGAALRTRLIVFKEFPAGYRSDLSRVFRRRASRVRQACRWRPSALTIRRSKPSCRARCPIARARI
jgi:hypothetical protein